MDVKDLNKYYRTELLGKFKRGFFDNELLKHDDQVDPAKCYVFGDGSKLCYTDCSIQEFFVQLVGPSGDLVYDSSKARIMVRALGCGEILNVRDTGEGVYKICYSARPGTSHGALAIIITIDGHPIRDYPVRPVVVPRMLNGQLTTAETVGNLFPEKIASAAQSSRRIDGSPSYKGALSFLLDDLSSDKKTGASKDLLFGLGKKDLNKRDNRPEMQSPQRKTIELFEGDETQYVNSSLDASGAPMLHLSSGSTAAGHEHILQIGKNEGARDNLQRKAAERLQMFAPAPAPILPAPQLADAIDKMDIGKPSLALLASKERRTAGDYLIQGSEVELVDKDEINRNLDMNSAAHRALRLKRMTQGLNLIGERQPLCLERGETILPEKASVRKAFIDQSLHAHARRSAWYSSQLTSLSKLCSQGVQVALQGEKSRRRLQEEQRLAESKTALMRMEGEKAFYRLYFGELDEEDIPFELPDHREAASLLEVEADKCAGLNAQVREVTARLENRRFVKEEELRTTLKMKAKEIRQRRDIVALWQDCLAKKRKRLGKTTAELLKSQKKASRLILEESKPTLRMLLQSGMDINDEGVEFGDEHNFNNSQVLNALRTGSVIRQIRDARRAVNHGVQFGEISPENPSMLPRTEIDADRAFEVKLERQRRKDNSSRDAAHGSDDVRRVKDLNHDDEEIQHRYESDDDTDGFTSICDDDVMYDDDDDDEGKGNTDRKKVSKTLDSVKSNQAPKQPFDLKFEMPRPQDFAVSGLTDAQSAHADRLKLVRAVASANNRFEAIREFEERPIFSSPTNRIIEFSGKYTEQVRDFHNKFKVGSYRHTQNPAAEPSGLPSPPSKVITYKPLPPNLNKEPEEFKKRKVCYGHGSSRPDFLMFSNGEFEITDAENRRKLLLQSAIDAELSRPEGRLHRYFALAADYGLSPDDLEPIWDYESNRVKLTRRLVPVDLDQHLMEITHKKLDGKEMKMLEMLKIEDLVDFLEKEGEISGDTGNSLVIPTKLFSFANEELSNFSKLKSDKQSMNAANDTGRSSKSSSKKKRNRNQDNSIPQANFGLNEGDENETDLQHDHGKKYISVDENLQGNQAPSSEGASEDALLDYSTPTGGWVLFDSTSSNMKDSEQRVGAANTDTSSNSANSNRKNNASMKISLVEENRYHKILKACPPQPPPGRPVRDIYSRNFEDKDFNNKDDNFDQKRSNDSDSDMDSGGDVLSIGSHTIDDVMSEISSGGMEEILENDEASIFNNNLIPPELKAGLMKEFKALRAGLAIGVPNPAIESGVLKSSTSRTSGEAVRKLDGRSKAEFEMKITSNTIGNPSDSKEDKMIQRLMSHSTFREALGILPPSNNTGSKSNQIASRIDSDSNQSLLSSIFTDVSSAQSSARGFEQIPKSMKDSPRTADAKKVIKILKQFLEEKNLSADQVKEKTLLAFNGTRPTILVERAERKTLLARDTLLESATVNGLNTTENKSGLSEVLLKQLAALQLGGGGKMNTSQDQDDDDLAFEEGAMGLVTKFIGEFLLESNGASVEALYRYIDAENESKTHAVALDASSSARYNNHPTKKLEGVQKKLNSEMMSSITPQAQSSWLYRHVGQPVGGALKADESFPTQLLGYASKYEGVSTQTHHTANLADEILGSDKRLPASNAGGIRAGNPMVPLGGDMASKRRLALMAQPPPPKK